MDNYPYNDIFLDHNLKFHEIIDVHSKYDSMHTNGIFDLLICINNHVNSYINCILSWLDPLFTLHLIIYH